jgi:hypothetical protein
MSAVVKPFRMQWSLLRYPCIHEIQQSFRRAM